MNVRFYVAIASLAALGGPAYGQMERRASLMGGGNGNQGKCTVEVVVDGAAEVDIRGDSANLRNLAGQQPQWRRFQCTGPLPSNPADFRFVGVDGRGRQQLVRDPRQGGVATVRIEDPQNGSEGYTFDIVWGGVGNRNGVGYNDQNRGFDPNRPGDRNFSRGRRMAPDEAMRACQDAIRQQAGDQFRTRDVVFRRVAVDDIPGQRDSVSGMVEVRGGNNQPQSYPFQCALDMNEGRILSARIDMGGNQRGGFRGPNANNDEAMRNCQRAVSDRVQRDGYGRVEFAQVRVDDRPGGNDSIIGNMRAQGRDRTDDFEFSCAVNLESGAVRSVDVRRR